MLGSFATFGFVTLSYLDDAFGPPVRSGSFMARALTYACDHRLLDGPLSSCSGHLDLGSGDAVAVTGPARSPLFPAPSPA